MDEIIQPVGMIAEYGILIAIAAIFLLAVVLILRHWLKKDAARAEAEKKRDNIREAKEDKRYDQLVELVKVTTDVAARGNKAIESSTEALKAVQHTTEAVAKSVDSTNSVLAEVCQDMKDQRHTTDKVFTELRVMGAKLEDQ